MAPPAVNGEGGKGGPSRGGALFGCCDAVVVPAPLISSGMISTCRLVGQCRTEWKLHDVSPFPNAVWHVSVV
jgi:hypothetical protein